MTEPDEEHKLYIFEIFGVRMFCVFNTGRWNSVQSFGEGGIDRTDKGQCIIEMLMHYCPERNISTETELNNLLTQMDKVGYIACVKVYINSYISVETPYNTMTTQIESDPVKYLNDNDVARREYARSLI